MPEQRRHSRQTKRRLWHPSEPAWWEQKRERLLELARTNPSAYVYDLASVGAAASALCALRHVDRVFYAIKANPHPEILKARHLVAGEYFAEANDIISRVDTNDLDQEAYLVEYYLLKAKIKSKLFQDDEAMALYDKAISRGWDRSEHYASEAALYAGIYAKSKGDLLTANDYWELALKIKGASDVYIEYIHDKAKSLIKRNRYEELATE